jgi:hypothetical protein
LFSKLHGWRFIFWFLGVFGVLVCGLIFAFMPETCRNVVNDGSVPPPWYNNSYTSYKIQRRRTRAGLSPNRFETRRFHLDVFLGMWHIVSDIESLLILLYASFVSSGYWCISSTLSAQYAKIYGFSDLIIGICFLPIAGGGLLVAVVNGKWDPIDGNYRRHAKLLGVSLEHTWEQSIVGFPIEKVRLQITSPLLLASCALVITYGWVLEAEVTVAAPLILLFFLGFCMMGMGKTIQILLMDLHPSRPATAATAFNVGRSLVGAGMVAVILPMIDTIGNGWAFTIIGISWLVLYPSLLWLQVQGPRWRKKRLELDL